MRVGCESPSSYDGQGKIAAGKTSDLLFNQVDILPTLAELTGTQAPADIDGLSILPELIGEKRAGREQDQHQYLYWEFGSQTAVRMKNWKAIQTKKIDLGNFTI